MIALERVQCRLCRQWHGPGALGYNALCVARCMQEAPYPQVMASMARFRCTCVCTCTCPATKRVAGPNSKPSIAVSRHLVFIICMNWVSKDRIVQSPPSPPWQARSELETPPRSHGHFKSWRCTLGSALTHRTSCNPIRPIVNVMLLHLFGLPHVHARSLLIWIVVLSCELWIHGAALPLVPAEIPAQS